MTKKHFKRLAEIIRVVQDKNERVYLMDAIGELCAQENKLFDWDKWADACNPEDEQ